MIRINLLAEEASKGGGSSKKATAQKAPSQSQANALTGVILAACLVIAGGGFYLSNKQVKAKRAEHQAARNDKERLTTEINNISPKAREMREAELRLKSQETVLLALDPPQRVLWSEKLAYLSELIPDDVFITRVEITENQQSVEIPETREAFDEWEQGGKEGEAPIVQQKPIVTYNMSIHGLASGETNVQQFDNVLKFHDALQNHKVTGTDGQKTGFMDQFNSTIEVQYVEATLFAGEYPVNEFVFVLRTLPPPEPVDAEEDNSAKEVAQAADSGV